MFCPNRWDYLEELSHLDGWAVGHERTALATVRALSSRVGKAYCIAWHVGSEGDLDPGDATVGATYEPSLDEAQEDVFIDAWVNMGAKRTIWNHETWKQFKRTVADIMCHEYIHSHQHRTKKDHRNYKKAPSDATPEERERNYLADPDEIDAYAHNVAAEFFDYWGLSNSRQAMDAWQQSVIPPPVTPSLHLWSYYKSFNDLEHPVMRKLMRRARSYLKEIRLQYLRYQVDG